MKIYRLIFALLCILATSARGMDGLNLGAPFYAMKEYFSPKPASLSLQQIKADIPWEDCKKPTSYLSLLPKEILDITKFYLVCGRRPTECHGNRFIAAAQLGMPIHLLEALEKYVQASNKTIYEIGKYERLGLIGYEIARVLELLDESLKYKSDRQHMVIPQSLIPQLLKIRSLVPIMMNSKNNNNVTPFLATIKPENKVPLEITKAFIDAGGDIHHDPMPLHLAARLGRADVVKMLLDFKVDPNISVKGKGVTALMEASVSGHVEIVKMLLTAGADPALTDSAGKTAHSYVMQELTRKIMRNENSFFSSFFDPHAKICELLKTAKEKKNE